jgi:hypothetical protein
VTFGRSRLLSKAKVAQTETVVAAIVCERVRESLACESVQQSLRQDSGRRACLLRFATEVEVELERHVIPAEKIM